jgi:hypothetical protein
MHRKYIWLFSLILLLTSCNKVTSYKYIYSGESKNWDATFQYEKIDNENNYILTLSYIGDINEISSSSEVTYSYIAGNKKGGGTLILNTSNHPLVIKDSGSTVNGTQLFEEDTILISVSWDDEYEEFELTIQNDTE